MNMDILKLKLRKPVKHKIACVTCGKNLYYFGDGEVEDLEIECDKCRE